MGFGGTNPDSALLMSIQLAELREDTLKVFELWDFGIAALAIHTPRGEIHRDT